MNEVFDEENELVEFDSENGVCHVEWMQPQGEPFEFWYCTTHGTDYYHECAMNPELAQNT